MYNACLQIIVLSIAATHREHRQTTKAVVIIIVVAIFSTITIISIITLAKQVGFFNNGRFQVRYQIKIGWWACLGRVQVLKNSID